MLPLGASSGGFTGDGFEFHRLICDWIRLVPRWCGRGDKALSNETLLN